MAMGDPSRWRAPIRTNDVVGHHLCMTDIPTAALVSELMRRQRIKWFSCTALVDDVQITRSGNHFEGFIESRRAEMLVDISRYLWRAGIPVFRQEKDEQRMALRLELKIPVFIREGVINDK